MPAPKMVCRARSSPRRHLVWCSSRRSSPSCLGIPLSGSTQSEGDQRVLCAEKRKPMHGYGSIQRRKEEVMTARARGKSSIRVTFDESAVARSWVSMSTVEG
ncbi:hypothetical protein CONLIGDRAFT_363479 [Coniochaeta ligniaria NRRL 30616]|uniref:Uncharacterized protein n=1 Tax=Coniochaeta ligniaria NRRL 30616 TaxID=1408157 RepID=A0A1J7JKE7_9PEZI|nr:hypothetical protein CONLIGDRAFT_363479 [Coniochaeta ligniaria NRRL 30616]